VGDVCKNIFLVVNGKAQYETDKGEHIYHILPGSLLNEHCLHHDQVPRFS